MKPSGAVTSPEGRDNTSAPLDNPSNAPQEPYVDAQVIARRYSVTPRHILKLATEGRIPSIRVGMTKGVRFLESEVAKVLEG